MTTESLYRVRSDEQGSSPEEDLGVCVQYSRGVDSSVRDKAQIGIGVLSGAFILSGCVLWVPSWRSWLGWVVNAQMILGLVLLICCVIALRNTRRWRAVHRKGDQRTFDEVLSQAADADGSVDDEGWRYLPADEIHSRVISGASSIRPEPGE